MVEKDFIPVLRFAVMSDIHIKDEPDIEKERFKKGILDAYKIAESHDTYKNLDALYIDGDLATSGSETQFRLAKKILDETIKDGTKVIASTASHEYNPTNGGVEAAWEKLRTIIGNEPDTHEVINGFHFIMTSPSKSCNFSDEKVKWAYENLKEAVLDDPKKPVFTFQHPHMTNTVYGSILWGEDELYDAYMHFPQIIDFSGHSHCPINDPRSIHQEHFTSLGTGTLSYIELDEFGKIGGPIPEDGREAAQMLIVEADANNRVRIYPYDIITGNFFPFVWKIDEPSNPESFEYTNENRFRSALKPYFKDGLKAEITALTDNSVSIEFPQAAADDIGYVNTYEVFVIRKADGVTVDQQSIWSSYYLYNMPKTKTAVIDGLDSKTEYTVKIKAKGFFENTSSNYLSVDFKTE